MEQRVFYDDCFISLRYEDEKESIVFIILKDAFYVYLDDRILQSRDIIFADKTWGYDKLLNPSTFSIFDAYSNDEYAKITFKNKEIDFQLNKCSLSGWLTKNKLKPNVNLVSSIRLYFHNLKCILKETDHDDSETELFILNKALII
ncbi:9532_t:CDS:1, partial [Cetraspora pellucida]